jgi:hypothetical protein
VAHTGEKNKKWKVVFRKPEGKRTLGRHRRKLKVNMRRILKM